MRNGGASVGPSLAFVAELVVLPLTVGTSAQARLALRTAGFWMIPPLATSMGWKCWNTLPWIVAPWVLVIFFRANLAGDVLDNLIPSAGIGGEFAKPYLLRGRMAMTACSSGVMANKTVEILSGVFFVAAGKLVMVEVLPLHSSTRMPSVIWKLQA